MEKHHFLVVVLPAQGSINPTLQLAKNLARAGAQVTFATTVYGRNRIKAFPRMDGLSFASFSDGYEDDISKGKSDPIGYMAQLKNLGSRNLVKLLQTFSNDGQPVTFLIYTILLPWVAKVARDMHVPSAFLAIQCATAFAIYHRFFNNHNGLCNDNTNSIDSSVSIKLMGLPLLTSNDLPTFLLPTSPYYAFTFPIFQEHIQTLEQDPNPCVLLNTFEALEEDSINSVDNMIRLIPIGPLIPSAFSDGNDLSDKSFGCDLFDRPKEYLQWLNSKPERSVVYVSFGSLVELQKTEKEEIFRGLLECGRPFLWVIRSSESEEEELKAMVENGLSDDKGLVVPWCSQIEVLHHKSIGCFVTHCGWNSTLESLVAGVPMVGWPHFSDQTTNAKLIDELWKVGVRAKVNEEEKCLITGEEIKRCLDLVMGDGERGKEIRNNSLKWKGLAMDAVKEDGSSHNNLKQFLKSLKSAT